MHDLQKPFNLSLLGVMNSTTAWNLSSLRSYIRAHCKDKEHLLELVSSIDRSNRIFVYHMTSARDAMKHFFSPGEANLESETLLAMLGGSERQDEFEWQKVISEAHLIGCLHTARGLWDIYGQLLNALVATAPLSIKDCDIVRVAKVLPASPLRDRVNSMLSGYWFGYLSAFINVTKHRQLIRHSTSISFEEDRAGVQVGAFEYKGQAFTKQWDVEVLQGAIEVKNEAITCGRELNAYLGI